MNEFKQLRHEIAIETETEKERMASDEATADDPLEDEVLEQTIDDDGAITVNTTATKNKSNHHPRCGGHCCFRREYEQLRSLDRSDVEPLFSDHALELGIEFARQKTIEASVHVAKPIPRHGGCMQAMRIWRRAILSYCDFGNIVDLASLVLIWYWLVRVLLLQAESGLTSQIAALTTALMWPRTIQFLSAWDIMAPYVRMAVAVTVDMSTFMLMLLILILGNAFTCMLLYPPNLKALAAESNFNASNVTSVAHFDTQLAEDKFGNLWKSIMSSIDMLFDLWDVEEAKHLAYSPSFAEVHHILYAIFVPLIMLNLVIALMGGTYERIENAKKVRLACYMQCDICDLSTCVVG